MLFPNPLRWELAFGLLHRVATICILFVEAGAALTPALSYICFSVYDQAMSHACVILVQIFTFFFC